MEHSEIIPRIDPLIYDVEDELNKLGGNINTLASSINGICQRIMDGLSDSSGRVAGMSEALHGFSGNLDTSGAKIDASGVDSVNQINEFTDELGNVSAKVTDFGNKISTFIFETNSTLSTIDGKLGDFSESVPGLKNSVMRHSSGHDAMSPSAASAASAIFCFFSFLSRIRSAGFGMRPKFTFIGWNFFASAVVM